MGYDRTKLCFTYDPYKSACKEIFLPYPQLKIYVLDNTCFSYIHVIKLGLAKQHPRSAPRPR